MTRSNKKKAAAAKIITRANAERASYSVARAGERLRDMKKAQKYSEASTSIKNLKAKQ